LFLKVADEDFRERNQIGITSSHLSTDSSEVHIEHVLPVSYLLSNKSDPYAWLEYFFNSENDTNKIRTQIDYLKNRDAHEISKGEAGYDEIEQIVEGIEERFVRDIGNMMLLDEAVNKPIRNRLFSIKVREYHNEHQKDMDNIINRYFDVDGAIPESKLKSILDLDIPDDETNSAAVPSVIQEFNEWWTYESLVERKAHIVSEIVDSLTFQTQPDEFAASKSDIKDIVADDIEKRLAVLTA